MNKRILALFLAFTMTFILAACNTDNSNDSSDRSDRVEDPFEDNSPSTENNVDSNENQDSDKDESSDNSEGNSDNTGNKVDSNQDQKDEKDQNEKKEPFTQLHFGDSIVTDFVEMTVETFGTAQELYPTDTSGVYSYYSDKENETYFFLIGTIKNIGGNSYSVEEMNIQLTFDGKYNYTGYIAADDGGNDFYGDVVNPLCSVKYYMYASVPDELINTYTTCTVKFAFQENFEHDYHSDFEKFAYCYTITVPDDGQGQNVVHDDSTGKSGNDTTDTTSFTNLNFGDQITLNFVEMTIKGAATSQELYPTDTSGVYSYYSDKENETYFYIYGTIKNVGGNSYSVEDMNVLLTFDGKYNYRGYVAADDGGNDFYGDTVKPFGQVKVYIYASIPDELINSYTTCTVKFAFHDEFKHDYATDFAKYAYCYKVDLVK